MSDEVATEEPKKPAAKRKPKAKPKAKKEPKKKGARKYNAALAMRVLYTLDAVPEGNKVKVGRKTVVFTKYARKALAENDHEKLKKILTCCDEPGCYEQISSGFPTDNGYRQTCGTHYRMYSPKHEERKNDIQSGD